VTNQEIYEACLRQHTRLTVLTERASDGLLTHRFHAYMVALTKQLNSLSTALNQEIAHAKAEAEALDADCP
jgi:hypothetical protein